MTESSLIPAVPFDVLASRMTIVRQPFDIAKPYYIVQCSAFNSAAHSLTQALELWNQKKTQVDSYSDWQIIAISYFENNRFVMEMKGTSNG